MCSSDLKVGSGIDSLDLGLAFPSAGTAGVSAFEYTVTVVGPDGSTVATSTTDTSAGSGTALASVAKPKPGTYTLQVSGTYAASDPDTLDSDSVLGRQVTLQAAQVRRG